VYTTYAYPYTVPTTSPSDALKGVDMAVWQAFQAHGCGTCFRPVLMTPSHLLDDPSGQTLPYYILSKLEFKTYDYMVDSYDDWGNLVRSIGEAGCKWTDVAWLNEPDKGARTLWRDQMTYISYGNNASTDLVYSHGAIIVGVPPIRDSVRQRLSMTFDDRVIDDQEDYGSERPLSD
jgi:hypothetical protein